MKTQKIIYWVVTGLFSAMILMGVSMYIFDHEKVKVMFAAMGYPTYLIYPLALVKVLGLVAIWTKLSPLLKEWAYAGFFFELSLGIGAHVMAKDGGFAPATAILMMVLVSYYLDGKLFGAARG
ncbi:hypothetical protein BKI52_30490 [marine bacterium AO1-C]|nr:hypothetical protein BKI52_30490 [marine bacterium AO1-C]